MAHRRERFERATNWLEPEANPSGIVYGVLLIGTLIAAEGAKSETYEDVVIACLITLFLYWLAHSYARHFASRLEQPNTSGIHWLIPALFHEAGLLKGAFIPIVVIALSWSLGASLALGVTIALWSSGIELVVLELFAGLRRRLAPGELAMEVALGAVLGTGLLAVRAVLY